MTKEDTTPSETETEIEVNQLDVYQTNAIRTLNPKLTPEQVLLNMALGLGESGEVQNLIKKHFFQGHQLDPIQVIDELGDILWYIAVLAHELGFDLSYVADENIGKLRRRYPQKFTEDQSVNRDG